MAFMYMIQQPPFLKELEKKGIILHLFEDHLWDTMVYYKYNPHITG